MSIIRPIYLFLRKRVRPISKLEKQTINGGVVGFEREFFSGKPNWDRLRSYPKSHLTKDEQDFINGPVEELCQMTDEWTMRQGDRTIPVSVWNFVINKGFLGLRVPIEHGGLGFSFQAQSTILTKIASRSIDVATLVGVPNSLGPDELISKYGTPDQKTFYLARFAQGKDIPCFAVTSPTAGSDILSMRDRGVVTRGKHKGEEVLGINLSWDKRYITLAPKSTIISLGFHLFDPDGLLKGDKDVGITMALIPANHDGVSIGHRHLPNGAAFPNGPIQGKDVFIPFDWIVGGVQGAGKGWKMIVESLFVGRAISLPAMSVGTIQAMVRYTSAYGRIRKQFGVSVGSIEGVQEPLARIVEMAYMSESARALTADAVDVSERSDVIGSLMKYQTTEYARRAVMDAMDVHGGKAICDGPSNYLLSAYQMAPIGITVEGANIITRSLIIFAQGVIQSHPYLKQEALALSDPNKTQGLRSFSRALRGHILFSFGTISRSFFHTLTGGMFVCRPKGVPSQLIHWYRQLTWESTRFAAISDIVATFLGSNLKKKQMISGRLADALSELYILSACLKRYEDEGYQPQDSSLVTLCMMNGLYRLEQALYWSVRNLPNPFLRTLLLVTVFPWGTTRSQATDQISCLVAREALQQGGMRDRLTRSMYVSHDITEPAGLLEAAFEKVSTAEPIYERLRVATRMGKVERFKSPGWIDRACDQGVISLSEADKLKESESLVERVVAVDQF